MVSLLLIIYGALYSPAVQTWLGKRVSSYVESRYGVHMSIGRIKIEFVKNIVLERIYVEDLEGDTLLYANLLEVNIDGYNLDRNRFNLSKLVLENARFRLVTEHYDSTLNINAVLAKFGTGDTIVDDSSSLYLQASEVSLKNVHFSYEILSDTTHGYGVDYEDLDVQRISASIEDLVMIDDSIRADINYIRLKEKSGFLLNRLSGEILISSTICDFSDLDLESRSTDLAGNYRMEYNSWADYQDFVSKVKMTADFKPSRINSDDIAYFAPALKSYHQEVVIQGKVKGTVDNLKGKDLDIRWLESTSFKGDADISGLPDFGTSFININAQRITTAPNDIQEILDTFADSTTTALPEELYALGTIEFSGSFTGFTNNFTSYGVFTTRAGVIKTDLSLKQKEKTYYYKGRLATEMFDVGLISGIPKLGRLSSSFTIEGTGLSKKDINADLKGNFRSLTYANYEYRNIILDGSIEQAKFTGVLTSKDPNANFDFNGEVDLRGRQPLMDFKANIYSANLSRLNLVNDSLDAQFSATLELKAQGIKLSEITGSVKVINLFYCQLGKEYYLGDLELIARNTPQRELQLISLIADITIRGNFIPEELPNSFMMLVSDAVPSVQPPLTRRIARQAFTFDAKIKDLAPLEIFLGKPIYFDTSTTVTGFYDNSVNTFEVRVISRTYSYAQYKGTGLNLLITKNNDVLTADVTNKTFSISDSLVLNNMDILGKAINDNVQLSFAWQNDEKNRGKFEIVGVVHSNKSFEADILPSEFSLKGERWVIDQNAHVFYDPARVTISGFRMVNNNQSLQVDGKISRSNNDKLNFILKDFDLATVALFLMPATRIAGRTSGSGYIANPYNDLNFQADLVVDSLKFNNEHVGHLNFKGNWLTSDSSIAIDAILMNGGMNSLDVKGVYRPFNDRNTYNLAIIMNKMPAQIANSFGVEEVTNFAGDVTGRINMTGSGSAPQLEGSLQMNNFSFKVVYLNTVYRINDKIVVKPDYFGFNRIRVQDEQGNWAVATGTAFHRNFERWNYDFALDIDNFLCLNTNSTHNNLFYGTAYATGDVNISGYEARLNIEVNARTEPGTKIAVPLAGAEEIAAQEFVRFINTGKDIEVEEIATLQGINLDFDLDVTDDAEVNLIFDEKIGDVIRGRGNGRINMQISQSGDFNMYGRYEITEGDYLFTLRNVINKRFDIRRGGTINWYGDPYEAYLDLVAEYRNVRAALYPIMLSEDERYKKREQVVCVMYMNGRLMEPTIRFDIQLPNADDFVRGQLAVVTNDENELNKQFLSLILGRGFSPLQNGVKSSEGSGNDALGSNSMELLSNQLNNWLSGVSREFSVGVNLRPGDEQNTGEYGLALSTQIFNDRVSVSTNVGVASRAVNSVSNTSNFVGDFIVEYSISEDGRLKLKAFNQTVDNIYTSNTLSPYIQGVGISYQEQFDTFSEFRKNFATLFERKKKKARRAAEEEAVDKANEMDVKSKEEEL